MPQHTPQRWEQSTTLHTQQHYGTASGQLEEHEGQHTNHTKQGTETAVEKAPTEATKCRIFAEQHWFHTANVKRHPTA